MPFFGPYIEILDVQIANAPAFDRPSLNISVRTWPAPEASFFTSTAAVAHHLHALSAPQHIELGFLTIKPAREQTGFLDNDAANRKNGDNSGASPKDLVAIELVSNTGAMLIEEGEQVGPSQLQLETRWSRHVPFVSDADDARIDFETAKRAFLLVKPDLLEERLDYVLMDGKSQRKTRRRVLKHYQKVHDYLIGPD